MLTCKEANRLASKAMDGELNWRERLALSLHITLCGMCRRYVRDMNKLRMLMIRLGKPGGILLPESLKLSGQSRQRIKRALSKAMGRSE